jgi:hypothetical protein
LIIILSVYKLHFLGFANGLQKGLQVMRHKGFFIFLQPFYF